MSGISTSIHKSVYERKEKEGSPSGRPFACILSVPSADAGQARADRDRFLRFVFALEAAGLAAEHREVCDIAGLESIFCRRKPDLVFSVPDHLPLHAAPTDVRAAPRSDSPHCNVHRFLEDSGIPYIGPSPEALELALSKADLKEQWLSGGVATPKFVRIPPQAGSGALAGMKLPPFPLIVKPAREGNSRGIFDDSVAFDTASLIKAVDRISGTHGELLVEQYVGAFPDFREFTVAMLGSGDRMVVMPAEIVFHHPKKLRVITSDDKDGQRTAALPLSEPALRKAVASFAQRAFLAAGVRDYARCDMAFADGNFTAIEVNGQPMVPDPWFEACAAHRGLSEPQYLTAIAFAAIVRHRSGGLFHRAIPQEMASVLPPWLYGALNRTSSLAGDGT